MTCSFSKEFSSSSITSIENTFITEYLPLATENSVKVYLYGLFLCQHPEQDRSLFEIADALKLTEKDVLEAFSFWEEFGIVSVLSSDPLKVQFEQLKNISLLKPKKFKAEKYGEFTKGIQALITERMISTNEYTEYFSIMEIYGIKPDAMLMIVKYCVDRKGPNIGFAYISKVCKDFGARGIVTVEKIENELQSYILRTSEIDRILKALSLKRQPDIEDQNFFIKWTHELQFDVENILFACKKLKKGSMEKLDAFLLELYSSKCFSKAEIEDYCIGKQSIFDLAIRINKALSIYVDIVETEVDTFVKKWLSFGYSDETLLLIASHLFRQGKNTLQDMDALIENLRTGGFIDLSSVGDYFESIKSQDAFIQKMLVSAGINRRPTSWDRENLSMWKSWNFSEDMILEASKMASGKTSAIAYINGILSNWKNKGIFTLSGVSSEQNYDKAPRENSQETYNREYERRRGISIRKAQKNSEIASEIPGFNDVVARLGSIEKDLAISEISGNTEALNTYENEKKGLTVKANSLLKLKGLKLSDLSPVCFCEKCKDTGYIGTKRCDCYDKFLDVK